MKKVVFFGLVLIFQSTLFAQNHISIIKAPLTIDQIWGTSTFYEKQPLTIKQLKDNEHYLTLENTAQASEIIKYQVNPNQKIETLLTAENLKIDRIQDYILSADESKLILVTNAEQIFRHSYTAKIYLYDIFSQQLVEIAPGQSGKRDFTFSPDNRFIVYSFQNDLYKYNIEDGVVKRLTHDGKMNERINGTADWVYEEEFAKTKFYDISYDGKYIAYISFEQKDVPPIILNYYKGEKYPEYETIKYPKVGEKNSVVKLHLLRTDENENKTIELGDYEYLPRLNFAGNTNTLIVQTLNRKQDHLNFYRVDCSKKSYRASLIYQETNPKYIEIEDQILFVPNEESFITLSDRDGYKHIYKMDFNGKSTLLTPGKYDVKELIGFTPGNEILFTAAYYSPINTSVHIVNLSGKDFRTISSDTQKTYDVSSYKSGNGYYYGYFTTANEPKTIAFFDLTGRITSLQETNEKLKSTLNAYDLQPKEFIKIKGVSDSLNASIIKPINFDPNKRYPVYFYVYCGPGSNTVNNRYDGPNLMYHELLAQKGYIVISIDTRGTQFRGFDFKSSTYGQLGNLELADLIASVQEISKWQYVDSSRIGIQGWSYGGFMSSLAITKGAEYFKTAIAVAPVTKWEFYDDVYTERYMNLLENNTKGYEENSPIFYTKNYKGNFLLIHGDADDNVHVQNSMELAKSLIQNNKDFDYFIYPNKNHSIWGVRTHLYHKMLKFTLENL